MRRLPSVISKITRKQEIRKVFKSCAITFLIFLTSEFSPLSQFIADFKSLIRQIILRNKCLSVRFASGTDCTQFRHLILPDYTLSCYLSHASRCRWWQRILSTSKYVAYSMTKATHTHATVVLKNSERLLTSRAVLRPCSYAVRIGSGLYGYRAFKIRPSINKICRVVNRFHCLQGNERCGINLSEVFKLP